VNGKVGRLLVAGYTKAGEFHSQCKTGVNKDVKPPDLKTRALLHFAGGA
jgi:hypothetical protein